jgi:hypothetical protein
MMITQDDLDKARRIASSFQAASKAATVSAYVTAMAVAERSVAEAIALARELGRLRAQIYDPREGAD